MEEKKEITAALITVSGSQPDESGINTPESFALKMLADAGINVVYTGVSSDDVGEISEQVQTAAINKVDFIFTMGGTGVSPRDYTARAMDPLLRFDIPGIAEAIRYVGVVRNDRRALLHRGRAGVLVTGRHRVLVVNASSSNEGIEDALGVVLPVLDHIIKQIQDTHNK